MPRGYHKPFTEADKQKIRDEYLLKPTKRLANEIGVTTDRVKRYLKLLGLEIPVELSKKWAQESRFTKGHETFNKGKKQEDYMSEEALRKVRATYFKKGNEPHNTKYDGAIAIRKENDKDHYYKWIRLSKSKWELLHRVIWEKENGKIPEGNVVVFKDGDSMNCTIENLEMITRIELMLRNSKAQYPEEIIPSMVLTCELENKLKQLTNG